MTRQLRKFFTPRLWDLEERTVPALILRSGAADDAAGITAIRDTFRDDLGGGTTAGPNGSFGGLRREINWDAVPAAKSAPNNLPADFFNVNSPRGALFSFPTGSPGSGFQVSGSTKDDGTGQPALDFENLNAGYPALFDAFSPQRLFTPVDANVMDVTFFVPGTNTPAATAGFGVIFCDVDIALTTKMQFFDRNGQTLGTFNVPASLVPGTNGSFSFLGVFDDAKDAVIAKVRITTGNVVVGADETPANDVVVMDDFLYGEPQAIVTTPNAFALVGDNLVPFDTNTPTLPGTPIPVTGLAGGETLVGIDYRPADGLLYGVSSQERLFTINTTTGAATLVATFSADPSDVTNPFTGFKGTRFGVDFNPVPDRLRIVSNTGQNLRVNPNNGFVITDGDVNPGTPEPTAAAYINNFAGTSTTKLYVIDTDSDTLNIQTPPNDGTLVLVGNLGVDATAINGFDILSTSQPSISNSAFALLEVGGVTSLYEITLGTGLAVIVGNLGDGTSAVSGLALAPPAKISFSAASATVDESAGTATITVTRGGAVSNTTTVDITLDGGTATIGQDFQFKPLTLTFGPDETTATFSVTILDDQIVEGIETIRFKLTPTSPANLGSFSTTTLVIRDGEISSGEAFAVTPTGNLVRFDPTAPGVITSTVAIQGLGSGEAIQGIDFRPANGALYGLAVNGTDGRLITINTSTGATTQIGDVFTVAGTNFGFDFNPVVDRIRVVSDADINLSVHPDTGVATAQTPLNPGDPSATAAAYTNSFATAGSTSLFVIDSTAGSLNTQNPPAGGTLTPVGPLGITADGVNGFDILAANNQAFAAFGGNLHVINLASGAATLIGPVGNNLILSGLALRDVPNAPPTISDVPNQTVTAGNNVGPLTLTVGDPDDDPTSLTVSAKSSNTALIPNSAIFFGGSGANRSLLITTTRGLVGTATITVTVTDPAGATASESFTVTVNSFGPQAFAQFAVGRDQGGTSTATLYNADATERFTLTPFGDSFTGGIRVAAADFTGDGIADIAVASGPGRPGEVRVFDGVTKAEIFSITPFGAEFNRGILVAAGDLNNDGLADLVITAEAGGGARMRVFQSTGAGFNQRADFIALIGSDGVADVNFRGGSRGAVADINGDGVGDLIFAAGAGGGPRIAVFNGAALGLNGGPKLIGDFFALNNTLRDGCYVAGGDFNGDGKQDLVVGGGSGAPPQVVIYDSAALLNNQFTKLADFLYPPDNKSQGVRVAVKDLNGDARPDLLVGHAPTAGSRVTGYNLTTLPATVPPPELFAFDAFANFTGGVFVG